MQNALSSGTGIFEPFSATLNSCPTEHLHNPTHNLIIPMKKVILFTHALATMMLLSGCISNKSNDGTPQAKAQMQPAHVKPVLDIQARKVKGKGTSGGFLNFSDWFDTQIISNSSAYLDASFLATLSYTERKALEKAIHDTCVAYNAEYLLAPHFEIRTSEFPILSFIWKHASCTVSGFPATTRSVRSLTPEEEMRLNANVDIRYIYHQDGKTNSETKKTNP